MNPDGSGAGRGLITLVTDFGTRDGYVGAMKGVILGEFPRAQLIDITHHVAAQDVIAGAFAIAQASPHYPPGTVHVGVVDPGVGSDRRAIVVEHRGMLFVGPDNGLFSLATIPVAGESPTVAWTIDRLPPHWTVHPTFHGRDVFARVAARLAAGASPGEFSSGTAPPLRLDLPHPERANGDLLGEVIHVDRFGNLITNLPGEALAAGHPVEIAGSQAVAGTTYADVGKGRLLAYVGSAGYVEVAVRDGSAAQLLGAGRGTRLRLRHA